MKKIIIIFTLLLLVGCKNNQDDLFKTPKGNITITKNLDYSNDDIQCYDKQYKPMILSEDEDKVNFINELNSLEYKELTDIHFEPSCGMSYVITWDGVGISIISVNKDKDSMIISLTRGEDSHIYELKGNIDFLDDYNFEELE